MATPMLEIVGGRPDEFPSPPYPSDVRSSGWMFNIDIQRMEQSMTFIKAAPELRPWLVFLWVKSWAQCPCGSLPAADDDIAAVIGMPENLFTANRTALMRGWVKHSDQRYYHRVITELVLQMMGKRRRDRERKALAKKDSDGFHRIPTDSTTVSVSVSGSVSGLTTLSTSQAKIDAVELLKFLNDKAKRDFRPTAKTLEPILGRLKEGYTIAECKAVVVRRCRDWLPDDKMRKFLRPITIFGAQKFAQYIGEVPPEEKPENVNETMP